MKMFTKKMLCLLIAVLLIAMAGSTAFATESNLSINDPEQLSQFIDNFVEQHEDTTAAMSVSVFTKNGILFEQSYGYANIADGIVNDADTVMDWGSVSKLLIWISVMHLVEQEKLDLDADIRTYLPAGFLSKLKYSNPITLKNLMNHDAGWQEMYLGIADSVVGWAVPNLAEAIKIAEPPQVYKPGEITAYSNFGANLAGYVVECVADKPFYEYVHENIFVVLSMDKTALKPGLHDNGWVKTQRTKLNCYTTDMQDMGNAPFSYEVYASGNTVGTISDLCKFAQALLPDENGASPLFRKSDTLSEMYVPTDYYADGKTIRNCHGFWAYPTLTGNVIGHSGNSNGCSAQLVIDPKRDIGIVILTNQGGETTYCMDMVGGIFGEKNFSAAPIDNDPVTGYYAYARSNREGISKTIGMPFVVSITQNKDGTLATGGWLPLLMGAMDIERIGSDLYWIDMFGQKILLYANSDECGRIKSLDTTMVTDLFRINAWEYHGNNIVLFAFVFTVIYALASLIIMLIRKLHKKKQLLGLLTAVVYVGVIAVFVNWLVVFLNGMFATGTVTGVVIQGILFTLLALIPVVYSIILVLRYKKLEATKKQKVEMIVTAVIGLVMTFFIIYWQLWMVV